MTTADDRDYRRQIHLPAGFVLSATSARIGLPAHCVTINPLIIIAILLYRKAV
jgi:hypothetical protein